jgi:hypothetical protein
MDAEYHALTKNKTWHLALLLHVLIRTLLTVSGSIKLRWKLMAVLID